jgi:rare lipoprotein A
MRSKGMVHFQLGGGTKVTYGRRMNFGGTQARIGKAAFVIAVLLLAACAPQRPPPTVIVPRMTRWKPYQTGIASWYRDRRTASGERFISSNFSGAHRTLPFGTLVRVSTVRTGRSCVVRINDRGPFIRGRIIDVSPAAAKMLGLNTSGIAKVNIDVEVK